MINSDGIGGKMFSRNIRRAIPNGPNVSIRLLTKASIGCALVLSLVLGGNADTPVSLLGRPRLKSASRRLSFRSDEGTTDHGRAYGIRNGWVRPECPGNDHINFRVRASSEMRHTRTYCTPLLSGAQPATSSESRFLRRIVILGTGPEHDERERRERLICERRALTRRRSKSPSCAVMSESRFRSKCLF